MYSTIDYSTIRLSFERFRWWGKFLQYQGFERCVAHPYLAETRMVSSGKNTYCESPFPRRLSLNLILESATVQRVREEPVAELNKKWKVSFLISSCLHNHFQMSLYMSWKWKSESWQLNFLKMSLPFTQDCLRRSFKNMNMIIIKFRLEGQHVLGHLDVCQNVLKYQIVSMYVLRFWNLRAFWSTSKRSGISGHSDLFPGKF